MASPIKRKETQQGLCVRGRRLAQGGSPLKRLHDGRRGNVGVPEEREGHPGGWPGSLEGRGWGARIGLALLGLISLILILTPDPVHSANQSLILATTTSTQDSGLLDFLLPIFERKTGYSVKMIAVGSGEALAMGSRGEADVLLVHSPEAEKKFMTEGHGLRRLPVMHNDFVIVGPAQDPARIQGTPSAVSAFKRMGQAQVSFVSRGDQSGTHKMELNLWKAAGLSPQGKWYVAAGQGMGETLRIADQKGGYTLVDRGTCLAMKKGLGLSILVEGDGALKNFYSVIELDPARHPKVNAAGGRAFADFLVSPETQRLIGIYGQDEYGQPLFFPNAKGTS